MSKFDNITDNKSFIAVYTKNVYTVRWLNWNNEILKEELVEYMGNSSAPNAPTKEGETFTGWSHTGINITKDIDIVALFSLSSYTVKWLDWNNTELKVEAVAHGTIVTPPDDPTREGYIFTGWGTTDYTITCDKTFIAQYEEDITQKTFTVLWKDWDGTTLKTESIEYNGVATPPNNPSRKGYKFIGWDNTNYIIKNDTTFVAQYEEVISSLTPNTWTSISELPYDIEDRNTGVVLYNDEIHLLGGNLGLAQVTVKYHYKYDGTKWVRLSDLPYEFSMGSAVVYNGEIHLIGGQYSLNKHYKYDGNTWTDLGDMPFDLQLSTAIVWNNEIHAISKNSSEVGEHYKWTGSSWVRVCSIPFESYSINWPENMDLVVYNNQMHLFADDAVDGERVHLKWTGSKWEQASDLINDGIWYQEVSNVVVYNNKIRVFGKWTQKVWDGNTWEEDDISLPNYFVNNVLLVIGSELHMLGGTGNTSSTPLSTKSHYAIYEPA